MGCPLSQQEREILEGMPLSAYEQDALENLGPSKEWVNQVEWLVSNSDPVKPKKVPARVSEAELRKERILAWMASHGNLATTADVRPMFEKEATCYNVMNSLVRAGRIMVVRDNPRIWRIRK